MTQQSNSSQPAKKTTARKTASKAAAKGASQPQDRQPKSNGRGDEQLFRITYNERTYTIGRKDLTDAEARLFRREMGCSLASGLLDPDIDVFVALVWLIDRRDDPTLTLDDYAGTMDYATVEDQVTR